MGCSYIGDFRFFFRIKIGSSFLELGFQDFFLFCFLRSFVVQFLCSETVCYFVFDMKNRRSFNNLVSNLCCHSSILMGKVEKIVLPKETSVVFLLIYVFVLCVYIHMHTHICILFVYLHKMRHTHMYIVRLSPRNAGIDRIGSTASTELLRGAVIIKPQ